MSKKDYKQGKIDLFNRLWDASLGQTKDPFKIFGLLVDEMMKVKEELGIEEGAGKN